MMPVYRNMDSQSHHSGNHQMYPTYHANPPMVYEPWPHSGNYGYPMPCNSGCSHGNFPGFHGFSPSYPRPTPLPPVHYCPVPYSPEAYPVYYLPPPHYSSEMPRFEYDKHMPWIQEHHCCGCSNQHLKEDKGVRIEEQEEPSVVEPKARGSLVPVQMKGYPFPVVWVPEEHLKEKLRPLSVNSREKEQNSLTGMSPLGGDKLKYLVDGGEEKRAQHQNIAKNKESPFPFIWMPSDDGDQDGERKENKDVNGDKRSDNRTKQFPFPIVWMSPQDTRPNEVGKGDGNGDGKQVNVSPKQVENLPYIFNFFPMKQICGKDASEIPNVKEENTVSKDKDGAEANVKEKSATQKSDLVKHVGPFKEEEKPKSKETNNEASKLVRTEGKRHSLSPPKSCKLPPICLRVDPLPKKSSRSPSPPERSRGNSNGSVTDSVSSKDSTQQVLNRNTLSNKEVKQKKMEPKVIAVTEKSSDQPQVSIERTSTELLEKLPVVETEKIGEDCHIQDETRIAEKATGSENSGYEKQLGKKTLSDVEAALRIQSAFRGFEMRRSKPLRKLKQISEVREQVDDVRKRIQALERSSDLRKDEKQKLIIGETIMRLLLQLDTIQGLHPSLRDIRKSLAKELVSLQDKLDSLAVETEKPKLDIHSAGAVEDLGLEAVKVECKQEQPEEKESNRSSEDVPKSAHDVVESNQDQLVPAMDSEHALKCKEMSVPAANAMPNVACEGNDQEVKVEEGDIKPEEPNSEAIAEVKEEVEYAVHNVCGTESMETEAVSKAHESEKPSEIPFEEVAKELETAQNSLEAIDATRVDNSTEIDLGEPPTEVADDEWTESEVDVEQVESENGKAVRSALASEATPQAMIEEAKMHELAELPVAVLDGDGNDELRGKESESQGSTKMASSEDETSVEIKKLDDVQPVAEVSDVGLDDKRDEPSLSSQPEESAQPLSTVGDRSQDGLDECAEANNVQAKKEPVEEEVGVEEVREVKVESSNEVAAEPEAENPTSDYVSNVESETKSERDKQLLEENEKLREMMAKLLEAGKEQLNVISDLSGRVKDLEKKLSRRKKLKTRQSRRSNEIVKDKVVGIAV